MIRFLLSLFLCLSAFAKEPPKLKVHDVTYRIEEMLRSHAYIREIDNEILERILFHFVEEMDRSKSYFLDNEITPFIKLDAQGLATLKKAIERGDFQYFNHILDIFKTAVTRRAQLENHPLLTKAAPVKMEWAEEPFAKTEDELLEKILKLRQHTLFMAEQIGSNMQEKILAWSDLRRQNTEAEWINLSKELEERTVHSTLLKAFARSLDAHTSYFTPDEAADFLVHVQQRLFGIGAILRDEFDGLNIVKLVEGGPAARSGKIQVEDKIIAVNGEPVMGLTIQDAVALIRGEKGSTVSLTILRKNEHHIVPIKREEVVVEESRYSYNTLQTESGLVLHFSLHSFYEDEETSSSKDFKKVFDSVKKQGPIAGLILDLRENSGGLMSQAVEIAGHFIHRGVVASVSDRVHGIYHMRNFHSPPTYRGPLVLLIDKASASSSEIVAQCLKDYGRALLVGDSSSFGKGSYQVLSVDNHRSIDPKGEYRITRGLYYTVSGNSPQLTGVVPHVIVPGPLDKLEIGEKHHKFALPSNAIPSSFIDQMLDLNPLVRMRAKRGLQQQRHHINDSTLKHLNQASKERLLKVKKPTDITYDQEKQLVLDEAVQILSHWSKFKESLLSY
ncbi:MAG: S41 family peptidase [Chlamydiia bacterium]